jgi:hypothetical protein
MKSGAEEPCGRDFKGILHSVIELDAYMHQQWAIFFSAANPTEAMRLGYRIMAPLQLRGMRRRDFAFDSRTMAPARPQLQLQEFELVGLVVSPALMRMGTAEGRGFDQMEVLVPARVLPQGFTSRNLRPKTAKDYSVFGLGKMPARVVGRHGSKYSGA